MQERRAGKQIEFAPVLNGLLDVGLAMFPSLGENKQKISKKDIAFKRRLDIFLAPRHPKGHVDSMFADR